VAFLARFFRKDLLKRYLRKKHRNPEATFFEEEVINEKFVNPSYVKPILPNHRLRLSNKRKHTTEISAAGTKVTSRADCRDMVIRFLNDGTTTEKHFKRSKCIISVEINK
jgi:hypothetical protein